MRAKPSFSTRIIFLIVAVCLVFSVRAQPYGLTSRANLAPFLNGVLPPAAPVVSGSWSAVPAFPSLLFTNPIGLSPVPGTNLLCVWEREGRVWSFVNVSNVTQKKLVLDIHNQCQGWGDCGLLGMAFHPGFATNHFMFVYYTWVTPGTVQGDISNQPPVFVSNGYHDRLSRFTLDTNGVAIAGSETVFVDQAGDCTWHNGGALFFNPANGFLYWTDGDDASSGNTQIITNKLMSGMFRIDVDQRGGSISHAPPRTPLNATTSNYFIPNDNPFVGQPNANEEFFCLGLRSPHRANVDAVSGRIFIGDVGEATKEEVDIIEAGESGLNFQWAVIEGLNGDLTPPYVGINRRPVLDYPHANGNYAVIGGYVYRGSQFAADLAGKYIFGDNVSDNVWVMDESTVPATKTILCTVPKGNGYDSGNDYTGLSSFGTDAAGEIYMCVMGSIGAPLYTLSRGSPVFVASPPALFSQLGAFTNLTTLAAAPALVPYDVNSPLWSDGAVKQRWIALATNTAITFYPTGEWSFPAGTVFFKNFALVTNENFPTQLRRLETRLLVCDTNGTVYGASYKWRADNSDADLLSNSTNENITITTATGSRTQTWFYPGRQDCLRCHTTAAGGVLGPKTRQLDGNFTYPSSGVTDNQLRTLNHLGFFSPALNEANIAGYPKLVSVLDTNWPLEIRARSYFDANCAHCHRPGGVNAQFDMRFDTPLVNQGLVSNTPLNSLNISNAFIVAPGSTARSVLFQRDNSVGSIQMPPLAKNLVDSNAMAVIAAWINSLGTVTNSSPAVTNGLPTPWLDTDLGAPLAGSVAFTNGTFTVNGSGDDIWNTADAGHLVYQPLTGDGQIVARVVSQQNTDPWAKAGVMFRETTSAGSRHVFLAVTPGNGTAMQWRTNIGDFSYSVAGPVQVAPYWVKLTRAGQVFTGSVSPNGTNWTAVASVTNAMSATVFAGLAVCAHNAAVLNTSVFDRANVTTPAPTWLPGTTGLAANKFHISVQGVDGWNYVVEASTNLTAWTPLFTNTPNGGLLLFTDSVTANLRNRFYRVHSQ